MTQCLHKDITLQSLTSFWSKKGHVIIICQWNMQGSPKIYMFMEYELSKINYFVIQLINFMMLFCSHDYYHEIKHETIKWIKKWLGLDYVHLCLPYYIHLKCSKICSRVPICTIFELYFNNCTLNCWICHQILLNFHVVGFCMMLMIGGSFHARS